MASTRKMLLNKKLAVGGILLFGGLLIGLSQFGGDGLEGRVRTATSSSSLPDLLVQDISTSSSGALSVQSGNKGKVDVTAGTAGHTYIYIDGTLKWTYSWTTLSDQTFLTAGGSATIQPQTLTDTHTVKACVDAKNIVTESNEDNNCLEGTLADGVFTKTSSTTTTTALPDLTIDSVSFDSTGHLTVKVKNKGTGNVTAGTAGVTSISIDGTEKWKYSWSTLSDTAFFKAGSTSTIQPEILTGTHTIKACVDTTSLVTESDETNNCTESSVESPLPALPDLVISDSDLSLSSTGALSVKVTNAGDADVATGTAGYTYIYLDGTAKWTYSWSTLSDTTFLTVGGSSSINPASLTGTHTLKACVDATSVVTESDETNNCSGEVSLTSSVADSSTTTSTGTTSGSATTGGGTTGKGTTGGKTGTGTTGTTGGTAIDGGTVTGTATPTVNIYGTGTSTTTPTVNTYGTDSTSTYNVPNY